MFILRVILTAIVWQASAVDAQTEAPAEPPTTMNRSSAESKIDSGALVISGDIDVGDVERIEVLLKQNPDLRRMRITSGGGNADAMMRLGRAIHRLKMEVRVGGNCAALCAFYIAPAAARMTFEQDAVLAFTAAPSPRYRAAALAISRRGAAGSVDALAAVERGDAALRRTMIAQDAYFREIGVEPQRMYLTVDVWFDALQAVDGPRAAAGRVAYIPSRQFLERCLELHNIALPKFGIEDSKRLAQKAVPIVVQVGTQLYFDGSPVPGGNPPCLSR